MKKNAKKILALSCLSLVALGAQAKSAKKTKGDGIVVISRESGSGTRGAFVELFGVEKKDAQGRKVDMTTLDADITNSTQVCLSSVAGNVSAIGYVSLGALNASVKALKIDGAVASAANVKNGSYKISRPFNVVTKEGASDAAREFLRFVMSDAGQAVVEKNGYISVGAQGAYEKRVTKGKVSVAGSSSVFPVMEKLQEAFASVNPGVTVEVSQSDSTVGIMSAAQGVCDIGMASRDLKAEESGVSATAIAIDGIAVIVNNARAVDGLSKAQVRDIFCGDITKWSAL